MALPSRRFSGEHANETVRPAATFAHACSSVRTVPTGSCDEQSTSAPSRKYGKRAHDLLNDVVDIRDIVVFDRCVEGDPNDLGRVHGVGKIVVNRQRS